VILATDGDFNVGASSDAEMERLIEEKRQQGTFLSVLGFGRGNLKDSKMEKLADKGNGNYAYIDDIAEAKKVFGAEMGGTLLTLAKDVKLQVEFNPERVASYRLIGYENRMLRKEDFDDDTKDAGEIGAGHSVTALYEVVPRASGRDEPAAEPLRYQAVARSAPRSGHGDELMYVKLRYKLPDAKTSRWLDHVIPASRASSGSTDLRFAASVAAFGMILRDSEYRGSATPDSVIEMARGALGRDEGGYRADFLKPRRAGSGSVAARGKGAVVQGRMWEVGGGRWEKLKAITAGFSGNLLWQFIPHPTSHIRFHYCLIGLGGIAPERSTFGRVGRFATSTVRSFTKFTIRP
jgi:Ca-activated chloride channel family protein